MGKLYPYLLPALLLIIAGCISPAPNSEVVADKDHTVSQTTSTPFEILNLSRMDVDEWASTSPDGQWVATGLVALPMLPADSEQSSADLAFTRVLIFNSHTNSKWPVIENSADVNLGFPFPIPLVWSVDSRFFYLTFTTTPDGCGPLSYLSGLIRVDLESGSVVVLVDKASSSWVALSPDQSMIAYIGTGGHGLFLRDQNGNESELNINPGKDYQAGHLVWSPDGRLVALTLITSPCGEVNAWRVSILVIDSETREIRSLLHEDTRFLITKEWNESGEIILADGNYINTNLNDIPYDLRWTIDTNSGAVKPWEP